MPLTASKTTQITAAKLLPTAGQPWLTPCMILLKHQQTPHKSEKCFFFSISKQMVNTWESHLTEGQRCLSPTAAWETTSLKELLSLLSSNQSMGGGLFSFSEIVFLVDFIFLTEKCGILATGPAKVTGEHWRPCVLQAGHCDRATHSVLLRSHLGAFTRPHWSGV